MVNMNSDLDSNSNLSRLKSLLREIFQLDRGDLDFGLYRIMKLKSAEIEDFLDNSLLPQVQEVLAEIADDHRTELELELKKTRRTASELGVRIDEVPKIAELKRRISDTKSNTEVEAEVYGHLVNFFAR